MGVLLCSLLQPRDKELVHRTESCLLSEYSVRAANTSKQKGRGVFMGENPSASRPGMKRQSWGQLLSMAIAIGVLFGTGAAVANHDPLIGVVVGATIVILVSISS